MRQRIREALMAKCTPSLAAWLDWSCPVCLMEHEEELHQATLRLKQWLRSELDRKLMRPEKAIREVVRPNITFSAKREAA